MRRIAILVMGGMVAAILAFTPVQAAPAEDLAGTLRKVVEENFAAYAKEDIERIMKTIHSQSPGYAETRRMSLEIFPEYDLTYELGNFTFIGQDKEYAFARVQQKTTKISGPQFNNNLIDVLFVFRQENGVWKFWSQALLETKFTQ